MSTSTPQSDQNDPGGGKTAVIAMALLVAACGIAALAFWSEPTAERSETSKTTAMLVDVREVAVDDHRPRIVAQGTVEPARDVVLRPEVEGRVVSRASGFEPGGFVQEGDRLFQIQPADYEYELAQRKSDLAVARNDLAVERGRAEAARVERDYLDEELSEQNEDLVLREPQLDAAKQRVDAARAAVEQAELNLSRTTVTAPFDAHILSRDVDVGSRVAAGGDVARLVGVDEFWVRMEIPTSKLRWIEVPEGESTGAEVRIRHPNSWPEGARRTGHISRLIGAVDDATRMARVLAVVPDPLAEKADEETPRLMVGEYVEATIDGVQLEDVVRLERQYVREEETVWVMEDESLQIRDVDVAVRDENFAYVTDGLQEGDRVVTTDLATVEEGASLRVEASDEETSDE